MSWLRKKDQGPSEPQRTDLSICEHLVLVPRWDRAEDVGQEKAASGYRCEACGAEFTPHQAIELRATEASRVQRLISA